MRAILSPCLLIATLLPTSFVASAAADDPTLHRVLHGEYRCGHVIDLLLRYGTSQHPGHQVNQWVQPTPFGPAVWNGSQIGDLELTSVHLADAGGPTSGPSYAIAITNTSERDIGDFRVSIVGLFGRIHPHSPTTVSKVDCLEAGTTIEVRICLPVEVLSMGRSGGEVLPFNTLVVAIDSYDEWLETDESNNLSILACEQIQPLPVTAAETPVTETPLAEEVPAVPSESTSPPTETLPTAPSDNPSATDEIDFDSLELGTATAAAVRTR